MKIENDYFYQSSCQRSKFFRYSGVASIEYALIAALIAVAILGALQITGSANGGIWSVWTTKFITATNGAIGQ